VSRSERAIEARQLVKIYPARGGRPPGHKPGIRALGGLDISVPRGIIYGLLGPNGAGKTTAVKVLTSLARPDQGTARIEGIDVLARPGQVRQHGQRRRRRRRPGGAGRPAAGRDRRRLGGGGPPLAG
jgi:ABC-2 type transport system ATP-binding protein